MKKDIILKTNLFILPTLIILFFISFRSNSFITFLILFIALLLIFLSFYIIGDRIKKNYVRILSIISIIGLALATLFILLLESMVSGGMEDIGLAIVGMLILLFYSILQTPLYLIILFGISKWIKPAIYSGTFLIMAIIFMIVSLFFNNLITSIFVLLSLLSGLISLVYLYVTLYKAYKLFYKNPSIKLNK